MDKLAKAYGIGRRTRREKGSLSMTEELEELICEFPHFAGAIHDAYRLGLNDENNELVEKGLAQLDLSSAGIVLSTSEVRRENEERYQYEPDANI